MADEVKVVEKEDTELVALQKQVVSLKDENEKLKAQKNTSKKSLDEINVIVDRVSNENKLLKDENDKVLKDLSLTKEKLAAALLTATAPAVESKADVGENCVFLDGKKYKIEHRNMVKELVEDYKRRLVDEQHTAVVINKIGG